MNGTQVMLGSGVFYCQKVTNASTAFSMSTLCVSGNQIGLIKGGATLSYSNTKKEVFDDSRAVYKKFITGDAATLKTGLITFDTEALAGLIDGEFTGHTTSTDVDSLKLGGKTRPAQLYDVAFVHTLESGETISIGMRATNDGGLELAFANDNETVVDLEFNAVSMDSDGTIVLIEETV